jgi:hypothetical protein
MNCQPSRKALSLCAGTLGEYDIRLIILLVACLVIAAELKAVKQIEEMNQRAELRVEAMDARAGSTVRK